MRPLIWMSAICAFVWGGTIPIYWISAHEPAGIAGLSFVTSMAILLLGYSLVTHARLPTQLDDDLDAEVADGAGELGFFPASSWAPLYASLAIGVLSVGAATGWWLMVVGGGLAIPATVFWVFEFYRGLQGH